MYKRIIILVMDSVGIGHAPDAAKFNDEGANTLGHIEATAGLIHWQILRILRPMKYLLWVLMGKWRKSAQGRIRPVVIGK